MFSAYFDASGDKRTRVLTVAGFVSRMTKWERFETQWRSLLPPTVTMFHMTDFVSSCKGWELWKGQSQKRAALIADLVACIRSHTNKGFAISMPLNDFRKVDSEYTLHEELGPPFAFASLACLGQMKEWATRKKADYRKVLSIFEDGDEDSGEMLQLTRADGFNTITQSKEHIRAFDASDLAAWKARAVIDDSFVRRLHEEDSAAATRIMASLDQLESMTQDNGMYSIKSLRAICEQRPVSKRG